MFQPLPQDDPKQRRPDISLAEDRLGWSPKIDLEKGLRMATAYFADRIGKG
jgi:UDP-glucuronate decarboxylase